MYNGKDLMQVLRQGANNAKAQRQQAEFERMEALKSGTNYCLTLLFKEVNNKARYEEINLEGFDNATMIFDAYRGIGHQLNLSNISLYLDDKKVKKVNFKY